MSSIVDTLNFLIKISNSDLYTMHNNMSKLIDIKNTILLSETKMHRNVQVYNYIFRKFSANLLLECNVFPPLFQKQ